MHGEGKFMTRLVVSYTKTGAIPNKSTVTDFAPRMFSGIKESFKISTA